MFNVFPGDGASVDSALTEHPEIEKISFTGGTATCRKVMASASSSSLKDVTMELGGKSPLIVCADADLDLAADIAMMANFYSSGQVCTNGTRVFVPRALRNAFEARLLARVQRIHIGGRSSAPRICSACWTISNRARPKARVCCAAASACKTAHWRRTTPWRRTFSATAPT